MIPDSVPHEPTADCDCMTCSNYRFPTADQRTPKAITNGPPNFEEMGRRIGALVAEKNKAYGDSFAQSGAILKVLYPSGVQPAQYGDVLAIARVLDKLFRIASDKRAFGESPWRDVAGYGILGWANDADD